MVRVEELSGKEIVVREKTSRLAKITRSEFGWWRVSEDRRMGNVYVWSLIPFRNNVQVNSDNNTVCVYYPRGFIQAVKLAQAYESAGEGGFTVRKRYEESVEESIDGSAERVGN